MGPGQAEVDDPLAPTTYRPPQPGLIRRFLRGLWFRQLQHYPDNGPRTLYLGIVVVVCITLYYQLYVQYSVATSIIREFDMSFTFFVYITVVGGAVGAFASLVAGLADRWGRANLVVYGLLGHGADHVLRAAQCGRQGNVHGAVRGAELHRGNGSRRDAGVDP